MRKQDKTVYMRKTPPDHGFPQVERPGFHKLEGSLLKLNTSLKLTQALVTSGMNSFTTIDC